MPLLILDDFCLDSMDAQESRHAYEILTDRHRRGSVIVTSNRGPDEWLATFADPIRAQSAIDRFANNAFDLIIEGESYRSRLKPALARTAEGPMDAAGLVENVDGFEVAGLGLRPPSHEPWENRPTAAGFPQRPQAAAADHSTFGELASMTRTA